MKIQIPKYLKIILAVSLIIILILLWSKNTYDNIYKDYFRLTSEEAVVHLKDVVSKCNKIKDCDLLPGDILIRRYVTERSETFDEYLKPYFIHAAVYLGGDEYFEALGLVEKPVDQIQVMKFSKSDWLDESLNTFVIIRPKNYGEKLDLILERYRQIADDPDYVFGLPKNDGRKETTCADVIVKELQKEAILPHADDEPKIISPDYLFLIMSRDQTNFEIVGYNYK